MNTNLSPFLAYVRGVERESTDDGVRAARTVAEGALQLLASVPFEEAKTLVEQAEPTHA